MSYNPYLANPYTGQQYFNVPMQQAQQPVQQNIQPQIQNGGLVSVRSIEEARNYPIAPGNSITFKDETAPYVYTKTMGFSQLDRPVFETYRLVKEEAPKTPEKEKTDNSPAYALQSEYEEIRRQIEALENEIETIKEQMPKRKTKKEAEDDGA